jgi:hypothetical protein
MPWQIQGVSVPEVETTLPTLTPGAEVELSCRFRNATSAYESLRAYGEVAGSYESGELLNHRLWYRERIRSDAPSGVDHVVLEVVPPSTATRTPAFWAALDEYADSTQTDTDEKTTTYILDLSMTVIATKDDYSSRSALEDALSDTLLG